MTTTAMRELTRQINQAIKESQTSKEVKRCQMRIFFRFT